MTECKYLKNCKMYPHYKKCTHDGIQMYKYTWEGAKPDYPSDEDIREKQCEIYFILNRHVMLENEVKE